MTLIQARVKQPLPSTERGIICHPGQVPLGGTRAGIQDNVPAKLVPDCDQGAENQTLHQVLVGLLDSGHPPAANSGMTGSADADLVSRGRGDLNRVKSIILFHFTNRKI